MAETLTYQITATVDAAGNPNPADITAQIIAAVNAVPGIVGVSASEIQTEEPRPVESD